jgi:hypothetical protein
MLLKTKARHPQQSGNSTFHHGPKGHARNGAGEWKISAICKFDNANSNVNSYVWQDEDGNVVDEFEDRNNGQ